MKLRSEHDREIARLAVPAFATLIAGPLYVLADTAIVGHLGSDELGGLALAVTVFLSIHGLLVFLAYGTTASVSRLIGAGDTAKAAFISVQGIWLAFLLGIPCAGLVWWKADWLLTILGGSGAALGFGRTYLVVGAIGFPSLLIMMAGAGSFHGRQNTTLPLVVAVGSALLNLVLEVIAVIWLDYGIGASALSTVVAEGAAAAIYLVKVGGWARQMGVSLAPAFSSILSLFGAGRALILRNIALRGAFTGATAVAARIGVTAVGGHQIGLQVWSALALGLDAVAIAGQALTGRWLGAGAADQARAAARRMIEIDVGLGVLVGGLVYATRHWIGAGFSTDPEVVAAAGIVLVWVAVTAPLNGYVFALDGILIGAGDHQYLGRTMMAASIVFGLLAWIVNATDAGLNWLWAALSAFMVLRAIGLWWRWRSNHWVVLGA